MKVRSRYLKLAQHLNEQKRGEIKLSFRQVEEIINYPLPPSAYRMKGWWTNTKYNAQAKYGWLLAGYRTTSIDIENQMVTFKRVEPPSPTLTAPKTGVGGAVAFEVLARSAMSRFYGVDLRRGVVEGVPWRFDLVSADHRVVGDALFLAAGKSAISHFPSISMRVWLLSKVRGARERFIAFGNDRSVPLAWLRRFRPVFSEPVKFFFVGGDGSVEELKGVED